MIIVRAKAAHTQPRFVALKLHKKTLSEDFKTAAGLSGTSDAFPQTVFMNLYHIKSLFYSSGRHIWHGITVIDVTTCKTEEKAHSPSRITNSVEKKLAGQPRSFLTAWFHIYVNNKKKYSSLSIFYPPVI